MTFKTNWLEWSFERFSRQFRIYVVEPKAYAPQTHGDVFDAVLRDFFDTASDLPVMGQASSAIREPVEADLIVFPEAFMAAEDLIIAMTAFVDRRFQCCVHVGLRPDSQRSNHLFSRQEIKDLLAGLKRINSVQAADLARFEHWFCDQRHGSRFNLACMFLVESSGSLRVCLHPKAVRAAVEYSALAEAHMTEANLLSLVTLVPPNSRYMSITIQPLICSDALSLPTDSLLPNPLKAFFDTSATAFPKLPADHVDIVSLSLCTPVGEAQGGEKRRRWRGEFESAFVDAGKRDECFRHHYASFVMANFDEIDKKKGGLSGACVPVPFRSGSYPDGVSVWSHGKHEQGRLDGWRRVAGTGVDAKLADMAAISEASRMHLVCLDGSAEPATHIAKALGFTLSRLVRDNPVGGLFPGLTKLDVRPVRGQTVAAAEQA
ncbi:hypothetical protein [Paraburkholderia caledonica]|uniref:hypothetical protein n=1 Tax=Paraburkholderia caledonica TaxID=134536 RepID=UPI0013E0BAEC|nr:hypothetical protein [Paraburkholderia caledonica]